MIRHRNRLPTPLRKPFATRGSMQTQHFRRLQRTALLPYSAGDVSASISATQEGRTLCSCDAWVVTVASFVIDARVHGRARSDENIAATIDRLSVDTSSVQLELPGATGNVCCSNMPHKHVYPPTSCSFSPQQACAYSHEYSFERTSIFVVLNSLSSFRASSSVSARIPRELRMFEAELSEVLSIQWHRGKKWNLCMGGLWRHRCWKPRIIAAASQCALTINPSITSMPGSIQDDLSSFPIFLFIRRLAFIQLLRWNGILRRWPRRWLRWRPLKKLFVHSPQTH